MREVREKAGLSPAAFAGAVGTSERAVQNWERGDNRPHPRFLNRMAELVPAFAAELRTEIAAYEWHPGRRRAPRGGLTIRTHGRRFKERTIVDAHTALDLVLDNAVSEIVKELQRFLEKHAAQWRER